jgi:hypothetical protein
MLRQKNPKKSAFRLRLEKAFPWLIFAVLLIGMFVNAMLTIHYRTEEQLAEKQACLRNIEKAGVDCTIYLGPPLQFSDPVADLDTTLPEAR